jgi:hypothetical protein
VAVSGHGAARPGTAGGLRCGFPLALRPPADPRGLDETLGASSLVVAAAAAQLCGCIWRYVTLLFSYFLPWLLPQIPSPSRTRPGRRAGCGRQRISSGPCAPESRWLSRGAAVGDLQRVPACAWPLACVHRCSLHGCSVRNRRQGDDSNRHQPRAMRLAPAACGRLACWPSPAVWIPSFVCTRESKLCRLFF